MQATADSSQSFAAPAPSSVAESADLAPMAAGGAIAPEPSGDTFTRFDENAVKVTAEQPVSTFSIDVDTASYTYVRFGS